jgi:cytosine/adenosine deaminase-related metal-dependent hydrolase
VPGAFAAAEARAALAAGLNVMLWSDNLSVRDEVALKRDALRRGLLLMGPDCGTAYVAGVGLGFANAVPSGRVGIVAASGTGLQAVATLLAGHGHGLSHAIGVGGRDMREEVGGLMTLAALDRLGADAATDLAVVIGKPPAPVGGVPYVDPDPRRHIDTVFDLAAEFDVDADFHADFFDEPGHLHARYIAEQTVRRGWQGRVALGHVSEMAALPPDEQDALARTLAAAGVAVIVLPATDLYLMGRKDVRSPRRGLAPVKRLLAAGVTVAAATNNVRNAFTPFGTAGLPLMGYLVGVGAHMGAELEIEQVLEMLTTHPARILRLPGYGLFPAAAADLVVWDSNRTDEVLSALSLCRLAVKGGRVPVEHTRSVAEPWRLKDAHLESR